MFEAPNLTITLQNFNVALVFKVVFLLMIILYGVISFFIYTKVLSLNTIVFFPPRTAANSVKTVALVNFVIVVVLFFFALFIPA